MNQQQDFTPIQRVALGRVVSKKSWDVARTRVKAGEHHVDFNVRVQGKITVKENFDVTPTHKMPWILALACAVRRSGIQAEGIVKVMQEILEEALAMQASNADEDTEAMAEFKAYAKEAEKAVHAGLQKLDKTKRNGSVLVGDLNTVGTNWLGSPNPWSSVLPSMFVPLTMSVCSGFAWQQNCCRH